MFLELEWLFEDELRVIPHSLTPHMLGLGRHVDERVVLGLCRDKYV